MYSPIQKRKFVVDGATWSSVKKVGNTERKEVANVERRQELNTAPASEEPTPSVTLDMYTESAPIASSLNSDFAEFKSTTLERMEKMTSKQTIFTVIISLLGITVVGLLVLVVFLYKKRRAIHKADVHLIPDIEKQPLTKVHTFDSRLRRLSSPRPKTAGKSPKMAPSSPKSVLSGQSTIIASPPVPQQALVTPKTPRSPPLPPKPVSKPKPPMPKEVADEVTDGKQPFDKVASPSIVSPASTNSRVTTFFGIPYRSSKRSPRLEAPTAIELPTEISRPSSRIIRSPSVEPMPTIIKPVNTTETAQIQRSRSKSMSASRPTSVPPSVMKMALEMQRRKTIELGDREDLQRLLVPVENDSKRNTKRISDIPGVPEIPTGTRFSAILVNIDAQEKIPIPEPSPAYSIMSDNSVLKSPKYKFGGRKSRSGSVVRSPMETIPVQNERASPNLKGERRSFSSTRQGLPQIAVSAPSMPRRASAGTTSTPSLRNPHSDSSTPPVPALPETAIVNKSPELRSISKMTPSKCPTPTEPVAPQSGTIEHNRAPSPEKLYPTMSSTQSYNLFPTMKSTSSAISSSGKKRYTAYTARSSVNSVGGHLIDRERNLLFVSPSPPASAAASPDRPPIVPPLSSTSHFPPPRPVPEIPRKHGNPRKYNSSYIASPPMRPESYGQVRKAATAPNSAASSKQNSPNPSFRTATPSPPLPKVPDEPPMLPEFTARMRDTVYSLGGFFQNVGRN